MALALARKYRPKSFAEVAVQSHVSNTLKGAIARGRVAHGYLLCGPRGTGKTTLARVLAMALNCEVRGARADGEPCGECASCRRIWSGASSLDVVEIDAASNRSVDDARDLRERAMYAPTGDDRYKVYIVDEAHMLTREAWNALLKVLEEPPPRVVFVFATTEPQKIAQTAAPILSRLQRFDLKRIGPAEIRERLAAVLTTENVPFESEALGMIARAADGGLRDALSLTDQVLSLGADAQVTAERVVEALGLVPEDEYLAIVDLIAERRARRRVRGRGPPRGRGGRLRPVPHRAGRRVARACSPWRWAARRRTRASGCAPALDARRDTIASAISCACCSCSSSSSRAFARAGSSDSCSRRCSFASRSWTARSTSSPCCASWGASRAVRQCAAGGAAASPASERTPRSVPVARDAVPTRAAPTSPAPRAVAPARDWAPLETPERPRGAPIDRSIGRLGDRRARSTGRRRGRARRALGGGGRPRARDAPARRLGARRVDSHGALGDRRRHDRAAGRRSTAAAREPGGRGPRGGPRRRALGVARRRPCAGAGRAGRAADHRTVRAERLASLTRRDPTLGAAIETLDLEILDGE